MAITISGSTGITSNEIQDGTITNADINSSAAIDGAKISGSFGKVLQVVTAEYSTTVSFATTTYTDIGLNATITPSSSSSKILVFWTQHCRHNANTAGTGSRLLRDSTVVWTTGSPFYTYAASGASHRDATDFRYLDSPNTTSAITYKIQASSNDSVSVSFNDNNNQSNILLMEIAG